MLDDIASVTLSTALSGVAAQQRVTANNIANIETPNFKAQQVDFADSLRSAVEAGDPGSATFTQSGVGGAVSANGNDVSLDDQTVAAEKEQLQYSLLSQALTSKYGLIESVLKG